MSSTNANIADLLLTKYYNQNNIISYGPNLSKQVSFPIVKRGFSTKVPNLVCPVPDACYKPKAKIFIDFTHQFTKTTTGDEAERPVSAKMLKSFGRDLYNYVYYYYNYVMSYGKEEYKDLQNIMNVMAKGAENASEFDICCFINTIVNYYLTDINIQQLRNGIGTCNITIRDAFNLRDNKKSSIFFNYAVPIFEQLFAPMLPIKVWATGRLYKDYYFPMFTGYIMFASQGNSAGYTSIQLVAKDILELARVSTDNINPALIQYAEATISKAINIMGQPLYGHDHFDIVKSLLAGGRLELSAEKRKLQTDITPNSKDQKSNSLEFTQLADFEVVKDGSTKELEDVISKRGIPINELTTYNMWYSIKKRPKLLMWGNNMTPYRTFMLSSPQIYSSNFSSRLQILEEVANICYYDFYVDGDGNFNYHPMRLTNDFLEKWYINISSDGSTKEYFLNPFRYTNVISNDELTNNSSSFNIEELCTFLHLEGTPDFDKLDNITQGLFGKAWDKSKMRKYGFRRKSCSNQMLNYNFTLFKNITFLDLAAYSLIKWINAELYTRSANMIFRPEIELCMPTYFVEDNSIFYVNSISHTITIGGDASTAINGNMGRKDYESPPDLMSYLLLQEKLYSSLSSNPSLIMEDIETLVRRIPVNEWVNSFEIEAESLVTYTDSIATV